MHILPNIVHTKIHKETYLRSPKPSGLTTQIPRAVCQSDVEAIADAIACVEI